MRSRNAIFVTVLTGGLLVACGGASPPRSEPESPSVVQSTQEPTQEPTIDSNKEALAEWAASSFDELEGVLTVTKSVANANTPADFHDLCSRLHEANNRLHETLPAPDARLTAAVDQFVDDVDTSVQYCDQAFHEDSPAALHLATEYMNRANVHIQEATSILDELD